MTHETTRRAGRFLTWLALVFVALAVLIFSMAMGAVFARSAHAHPSKVTAPLVTTVTMADVAPFPLAVATSTAARPGEGVIRITTRVCGNASNWQSVAAANGIKAPVYLVLLGQTLSVSCAGGSAPAPQQQAPAPVQAPGGWYSPLCGGIGDRLGAGRNHRGVDISAGHGAPIRAIAAGTVTTAWQGGGAGNYTMIVHTGGVASVYMHQSSFAVRGGWVNGGQVIGYVGATGDASGPHLHFEVHPWGLWQGVTDPINFLAQRGVRIC